MARVRVYIATSLDGYIAGEGDDLSWLPTDPVADPGDALTYEAFMADVGALLMGRRTYDVVRGFGGEWPYGETPVLVATHRPLQDAPSTVSAVQGDIDALLEQALTRAQGRDVYIDGGRLIQQALAAGRVDELVLTVVPVLLGRGTRLFGEGEAIPLTFSAPTLYGSMVQLRATPS